MHVLCTFDPSIVDGSCQGRIKMDSVENKPFFEMSPLAASHESGGNSLSFNGSKNAGPATSGASAMSTDSLASRAPFGELQVLTTIYWMHQFEL